MVESSATVFRFTGGVFFERLFTMSFWALSFFLSGGIAIKGMPIPLLVAAVPYLLQRDKRQGYPLLLIMGLGALWGYGPGSFFLTYFIVVVATVILNIFVPIDKYNNYFYLYQITILLGLRLLIFPLAVDSLLHLLLLLGELLLLFLLQLFFKEAFADETLLLPVPFFLLVIGSINCSSVSFGFLVPIFLVLILGKTAGYGVGMAAGLIMGILRSVAGVGGLYEMGYFPLLGLSAGILPHYSRWVYFAGVLGISVFFTYLMEYTSVLVYLLLFFGVFIFTIITLYLPAGSFLKNKQQLLVAGYDYNKKVSEAERIFNTKFIALAGVFNMLSRVFQESHSGEKGLGEEFIQKFIDTVTRGVCHKCPKHKECWQDKYTRTYRGFYSIFSLYPQSQDIDSAKIKEMFNVPCIDWNRLLPVIREGLDAYRLHYFWQRELFEQQDLLAQQMGEMGEVILNLAKEVQETYYTQKNKKELIEQILTSKGYMVKNLAIRYYRKNFEIQLQVNPCGGQNHCRTHILSLLRNALGCQLAIHVKRCGFVTHGNCQLSLAPRSIYKVEVGIVAISSSQERVSGDRFFFNELENGRFVAIISDGMGTGYSAARESSATIALLDKILNAGFSYDLAIRAINAALNLKNKGEKFATIDMFIFDTYSGRCNVVKVGAAPSFLRHLQEVFVLEGNTPPAGILNKIKTSTREFYLEEGDIMLLLSDGALTEGYNMQKRFKQEMLTGRLPEGAQAKAEHFLALVKEDRLKIADDITILLLEIERS